MNNQYRPSNSQPTTRAVDRLTDAVSFQRKLLNGNPIRRDIFAESEAVASWPFVIAAYPLVEQCFKCLLDLRQIEYPRQGFKGHWIYDELYKKLEDRDKNSIHRSYKAYRSLHAYIPHRTADDFLRSIGRSYNSWRYFLLEGGQVSTTHPGAMIEIASAATDLLCAEVFTDHGIQTINRRIRFSIMQLLWQDAWLKCLQDPSLGIGENEIKDMNDWIRGYENIIDAFANLARADHARSLESMAVLPNTREILMQAVRIARDDKDRDMQYFLRLAEQGPRPLIWNAAEGVFQQ